MKKLTLGEARQMITSLDMDSLGLDSFNAYFLPDDDNCTFDEDAVVAILLFAGGRGILEPVVEKLNELLPRLIFKVYLDSEYVEVYEHELIEKEFMCVWGEGYINVTNEASIENHDLDWFTTDRGYELEDIARLNDLRLGDSLDLSSPAGIHTIVRIK